MAPTPALSPGGSHGRRGLVGCSPWGHEESDTTERLHFHALEKEMATHSSVLAWRIPGTGEPGWLLSMGLHRVGHDLSDLSDLAAAASIPVTDILLGLSRELLDDRMTKLLNKFCKSFWGLPSVLPRSTTMGWICYSSHGSLSRWINQWIVNESHRHHLPIAFLLFPL